MDTAHNAPRHPLHAPEAAGPRTGDTGHTGGTGGTGGTGHGSMPGPGAGRAPELVNAQAQERGHPHVHAHVHRHAPTHNHTHKHAHNHAHTHAAHRPAVPLLGDTLMCASAGQRLAWAALPVGLVWALVAWALL